MKNKNKSIQMKYTAELVRAQLENRLPEKIPDGILIEELEKIAHANHMDYMILGALIKLPLEQDVVDRFRIYLKRSTLKTLQQVRSCQELQEKFEKEGIRNQVLKGSVLKFIYPRPELREMSDIDFMIYEDDFSKPEQMILDKGYERLEAVKHHVIYRKQPFLVLEMHWDLYEKTVDKEQYMYYKNQFRATLKEGCQYTYEFSKEDFYVYMISHMAKHFYENGCGIRNLVDIYVYLNKYGQSMNRDKIEQELKKCGIYDFEKYMTELAYIWLDNRESNDFYNHMFMYMLDCGIYGKGENGIWSQLAKQESSVDKRQDNYKWNFYFPPLGYMKEHYPWLERREILLPIAWLCRGIHGIADKNALGRVKKLKDEEQYDIMMDIYNKLKLNFVK